MANRATSHGPWDTAEAVLEPSHPLQWPRLFPRPSKTSGERAGSQTLTPQRTCFVEGSRYLNISLQSHTFEVLGATFPKPPG